MENRYKTLFTEIAHAVEVIAEQSLEIETKNKDEKGEHAAGIMREDFSKLYDKLRDEKEELSRADYAKLLVGAFIVAKGLEQRIENEKTALQGYKIDTIPKLNRIVNESNTDEEARKLAEEIFTINIWLFSKFMI